MGVLSKMIDIDKMHRRFLQSLVTKNLYTLRVLAGLTTNELASLIGTTRQSINSLENGKTDRMNGAMLVATKAVLSERANDNKEDRFELSLLKHVLSLLFDMTSPSDDYLNYKYMCITDAFLAVAKLSEARFSEDKLEKLSEAVLKAELADELNVTGADESGEQIFNRLYDVIGLHTFFDERKKLKENRRQLMREKYLEDDLENHLKGGSAE